MASSTTNISISAFDRMRAVFDSIGALLIRIAESSPKYKLLEQYNALSDEELAERGMTRLDVVERVLGPRIHY